MLDAFLSLFLERKCPLCDRSANLVICQYCEHQINQSRNSRPAHLWFSDLPVYVWGHYDGKLKQLITTMKYNNQPEIGGLLGENLAQSWQQYSPIKLQSFQVIPIPLHSERLKQRGFNQANIIAKSFCRLTGAKLRSQALKRVRATQRMYNLNPRQRQENINNAFQINRAIINTLRLSPILLMDDIYTTGTTAREAAKVLSMAGITVIGVAAIASSQKV